MRCVPVLFALFLAASAGASPSPAATGYDEIRAAMLDAFGRGDYTGADAHAARILELRPNHPPTIRNRAVLGMLRGDADFALQWLERLALTGTQFDVVREDAFAPLRDDPRFTAIAARLAANAGTPAVSDLAFSIRRPDFIPEGLAYDRGRGRLFVGSIRHREIVQLAGDGSATQFVAPAAHGLGSVMGMTVDSCRDRLWVASATTPQMRPASEQDATGIWEFRLADGAFVARHLLPDTGARQVLGDVVIADDGRLFASESQLGGVFELDPATGTFHVIIEPGRLRSAQGLTPSADGKRLYVADYANGLHAVDLDDRTLQRLRMPDDAHDYGVDGLYRHGNALIAIQNLIAPHRVAEFRLADDGASVSAVRVLEAALPDYSEPTLGVIVDDALLYVANSQWNRFTDDNELPPASELNPPVIRRLPLGSPSVTSPCRSPPQRAQRPFPRGPAGYSATESAAASRH